MSKSRDSDSPPKMALPNKSKQTLSEMKADLKLAADEFRKLFNSYMLPPEYDFLYSAGTSSDATLSDYLGYTATTDLGYYRARDGEVAPAYAKAPILDALGRPNGPMIFYKGSMSGDIYDDLDTYAHEVLHRNPDFANEAFKASNLDQIEILHSQKMQPVIDKVVNMAKKQGYGN